MGDISNPFYLHHGDNLGVSLVSQVLTGENCHTWSRSMIMALGAKNKLRFVEGTIKKPTKENPEYSLWVLCNNMLLSLILNSLSKTIASSFIFIELVEDMWNELKERFP